MMRSGTTKVKPLQVAPTCVWRLIISVVLYQCALKRDLSLFDAGDQTEVGEKGITLRYVSSLAYRKLCAQLFM